VILSFPFLFVFKSGPLNYFLPHVTDLDKELEEKEDKEMELILTLLVYVCYSSGIRTDAHSM
jgi:hypothetical protein